MSVHPDEFLRADADAATGPIGLRWLGTASYELTADGFTLLIDPYLTRVGMWRFLTRRIMPNTARIDAAIERADAIVVGHSHFDHVMDVPYIAQQTGAVVYGSKSTANLMAAAGLPADKVVSCEAGDVLEVGPFKVTLTPSCHSEFALGKKVPYAGDIPAGCDIPTRGKHYRCGDVFALAVEREGYCIYHMGSANLVDDAISHRDVDLFLMGISARHNTERYVERVLGRLTPRVVMPMHYDNFFRAAAKPMKLLPLTKFGRFVDDVRAVDDQIEIWTLPVGGRTAVG